MRRRLPPLLGLVLFIALLSACGSTHASTRTGEGAGTFATRILREELNGQWSRQWLELHPGHQKLITRAEYVACSRQLGTNVAAGNEIYHVVSVKNVAIHVLDVPQTKAALVTITVRTAGNPTTPPYSLHAVDVNGRWKWILGNRFLAAVRRGQCLDGSPLAKKP